MKKKNADNLTMKQEAFVEHYLANGGNGVQAALAAGYQGNVNTLNQVARDNLQKPTISARIRARLNGLKASTDEILLLLSDHLRGDLGDLADCFDDNGQLDITKAKERDLSRLIRRYKTTRRTLKRKEGATETIITSKVELHDSQAAARLLVKIYGLKQVPAENDTDVEANKRAAEKAHKCYKYLLEQCQGDKRAALAVMQDKYPNLRANLSSEVLKVGSDGDSILTGEQKSTPLEHLSIGQNQNEEVAKTFAEQLAEAMEILARGNGKVAAELTGKLG